MLVRVATEADLDAITEIHMTAVPMDPECPYRYPYREEFSEDHRRFSRVEYASYMQDQQAVVMVAEIESKATQDVSKVIAFSVWHLPGSHASKEPGDVRTIAIAPPTPETPWIRRDANLARVVAFRESITKAKLTFFGSKYGEDQIYLGMLACHPNYQRRGAGEMLLRYGVEKAKTGGLPVTLVASPMGMRLYNRLGFKLVGEFWTQAEGEVESLHSRCMVLETDQPKVPVDTALSDRWYGTLAI